VAIAGLLLWPAPDLSALVWTLVAGSIVQCCVVTTGAYGLALRFPVWTNAGAADVRRTLSLALPMLPSAMLANAVMPILQFNAARLGEGAVAIFSYAARLHGGVSQLLIMGLSTVLLPHLASLWALGQKDEIAILFQRLARWTVFVAAFLTLGILLMGETATQVLFQRGAFEAAQVTKVSNAWMLLSLALLPHMFGTFIAKFCQAMRNARTLLMSSTILFVTTLIAGWYGSSTGTVSGIAGAFVAGFFATGIYWVVWLGRQIHSAPALRDIAISLFRCAFILAPAYAAEISVGSISTLPVIDLLCRGAVYTTTVLLLLVATGSYSWFLARDPE
jgi:putative peptidoglycan lipid II flippase